MTTIYHTSLFQLQAIVAQCKFPGYSLEAIQVDGALYIRAKYSEADTVTGEMERQQTRQWVVEPCASISEVVATCFKCIITSHEHRVREWFTYQNKPIYQPHHDVDKLLSITEARA